MNARLITLVGPGGGGGEGLAGSVEGRQLFYSQGTEIYKIGSLASAPPMGSAMLTTVPKAPGKTR